MKNKFTAHNFYLKFFIVIFLIGYCQILQVYSQNILVKYLTCEYILNPLGVDKAQPLLGWQIQSDQSGMHQTSYQVLVASSRGILNKNTGDIWNSGKIASSQSQNIFYTGPLLRSGKYYYWKVKVWDEKSKPAAWSESAYWSVGLLKKDDWQGKWISNKYSAVSSKRNYVDIWTNKVGYVSADTAAVYLRKTFQIQQKIKKATAYISGLGYYELYLNGRKTGNRVMDPAFTDYQRQVNYITYDLTAALKQGKNAIGVILGNGFYNSPTEDLFQMEKANWKTSPKLLFDLHIEYTNGQRAIISSDEAWKWSTGEIVYNSIRSGETIDHRKQQKDWNTSLFNDSSWKNAVSVPDPLGELKTQYIPPMRVNENIRPEKIFEPKKGVYIVDFGKNITGWVSLKVKGKSGQKIQCWYNEALNKDSTLNKKYSSSHTGGRFQEEEFILNGEDEEDFEPRFTYHGFRYVQLDGLLEKPAPGNITAKSVHTSLDTIGYFACSNEKITHLQLAVQRTLLNCIHGIPGEEPTREKMGWTQDASNTMESYLYNFDAINTYKKSLQDFIDTQEPGGHIAAIVPTNGWSFLTSEGKSCYYDDPWWGGTIIYIVDKLYEHTGDTATIAHAFDAMKRYVDYVSTTAKDDLVYWSLGDWLDMTFTSKKGPGLTPVVQTSTAGYYWMNERLAAFGKILGKNTIASHYSKKAQLIRDKFNVAFLDRNTGWYKEGSQTAQALPLYLGLVPTEMISKVESKLIEAIEKNGDHVNTGFIGVLPFLNYLATNGYMLKVYKVFRQEESPGWLQMVANEKNTLSENLNQKGYGTGHHPFGAHIGSWLFKFLGGIRTDPAFPGFQKFIIAPQFIPDINWVTTETHSLYGKIVSSWKRENGRISFHVVIPGNTSAELFLPMSSENRITANGKNLSELSSIKKLGKRNECIVLQVGSGNYEFQIQQ